MPSPKVRMDPLYGQVPHTPNTALEVELARQNNELLARLAQATAMPRPDLSAYEKQATKEAIQELIADLQDLAPAITDAQKATIFDILGPLYDTHDELPGTGQVDIDAVTEQYMLVKSIKRKVMDPHGTLHYHASARELTSLVNAINSVISLFIRHQDRMDTLAQVQELKRAINAALEDSPEEVKRKFLQALEGRLAEKG